jgi:chromosome partitioning protein
MYSRHTAAGLLLYHTHTTLEMMPIVIAVANQKGGCGKTTISMNLAGALAREGDYRVLFIDADPQASAMQWRKNSEESALPFDLQPFPHPVLHKEMAKLGANYDLVFVDCPPGGGSQAAGADLARDICRSALRAADVVLVPIRPTPLDYHASHTLLPMIRDVAFLNEKLKVFIVINGKAAGKTKLGEEASALAVDLFQVEGVNIRVLKSEVCTRQTFAQSPLVGKVVVDYDPQSKAAQEIRTITEELVQCLVTEAQASVS